MAKIMDIKVKKDDSDLEDDQGLDDLEIKTIQIERLQKKINDLKTTFEKSKLNYAE